MFQWHTAIPYIMAMALIAFASCPTGLADNAVRSQQVSRRNNASLFDQHKYAKVAVTHYNRGVDFHIKGDFDRAIEEYRAAVDSDEHLQPAWSNMGTIYSAQGHRDEAINSFKKALAIKKDPLTLSAYASVLWSNNHTAEAITFWQTALELDPTFTAAATALADALERTGKPDAAQAVRKKYNSSTTHPPGDYTTPAGKPIIKPDS